MIYVENTSNYPQRVYIPRDEENVNDLRGYVFQRKDLDIDQNGEYYLYPDAGYDGITAGTINVHVPTDTQEAYDQGYADGEEAQKSKLEPLTANTNGHYSREDGYSDVYVDVEGGGDYSSGYTDGMAAQKALLTSTTFTENGHFEREDGWNEVDVRLYLPSLHTAITENGRVVYQPPQGAQGFDSVEIDVQVPQTGGTAVLSSLTATTNGDYTPEQGTDGWSAVTVNVDTASTYNSGYTEGYSAGTADTRALFTAITATTNGLYTSDTGYSAVTVNVPTTGETYPRSHVTVYINTDDMEGLIGTVFNLEINSQLVSAFTVTTTADTAFTATLNPGYYFHFYATPPIGYQGYFDTWDYTYWNEDRGYNADFYRYDPASTTIVTARTTNDVTAADLGYLTGLAFAGSSSALTGPTNVTYDAGEDKWYLEYPGTLVKGFSFDSTHLPNTKIIGIELPSSVSEIGGFGYASNLEYVYGEGITKIGRFPDTGFGQCTALTSFTASQSDIQVGASAFEDCWNLSESNMFPIYSVNFMGDNAFKNCYSIQGAIEINAPEINSQAFAGCTGITNVYINADCTFVDDWAFSGCTNLNWIWCFPTTAPRLGTGNPFSGVSSTGTLYIKTGADYSTWIAKLPNDWGIGYFG